MAGHLEHKVRVPVVEIDQRLTSWKHEVRRRTVDRTADMEASTAVAMGIFKLGGRNGRLRRMGKKEEMAHLWFSGR